MSPLRRFSIRVRLTLGTLVIAIVFFAGTAVVVNRQVESILTSSSVMLLQGDAAQYQQEIADGRGENLGTPAQGQLVAVIDPAGRVMQSSLPDELAPQLASLSAAGPATQTVHTPAAQYLVVAREVTVADGTWHIVTARNEAASELSLDNLTRALALGLVILTLLLGLGSWLLASAALRPVSAMRRTAERLRGSASVELLPVGPARDELFDLATTLNDLIRQLRASADREKQLVSDASHELRTPLAILQTQLELAHLSTGDAEALLGEIESAEQTVKRLSALAASLLELTRIEGMTARETTTFDDLAEELVDAIDRARLLSIGSEIVVDYEIAADPPVTQGDTGSTAHAAERDDLPSGAVQEVTPVELSRRSFGRVVDNLLGNAIVAMKESRPAASADVAPLAVVPPLADGPPMAVPPPLVAMPTGVVAPPLVVVPTGAAVRPSTVVPTAAVVPPPIEEPGTTECAGADFVPTGDGRAQGIPPSVAARDDVEGLGSAPATLRPARDIVRATLIAAADGGVTLEIVDTGPGMSAEFLPLAFDRFAREDESRGGTRPGSRGAGLGLSIVQALITSAGGTVTMTNRQPRGLGVVVSIPVARAGEHPVTPPHGTPYHSLNPPGDGPLHEGAALAPTPPGSVPPPLDSVPLSPGSVPLPSHSVRDSSSPFGSPLHSSGRPASQEPPA